MFDLEAHNSLMEKCKEFEFFETDPWAADRILDVELLTETVLDPCAGRGVLGDALSAHGYQALEADLNEWPGQSRRILTGMDFVGPFEQVQREWGFMINAPGGFSVMMNPPFSKAVQFVERSLELGARKVLMFQRHNFLESGDRRGFYERLPPARIWLCGNRATCWRGDMPEEDVLDEAGTVIVKGRKGRSAPTAHAWFVWERGHRGLMATHHLYKE